jgi:hypothetical protein
MKNRTPISLFPFLSVLLCTMGVLSFLAVTFLMFSRPEAAREEQAEPVEVRWVGAPERVRPLLMEVRLDTLVLHPAAGEPSRTFTREALQREVDVVRELLAAGTGQMGPAPSESELWLYLKTVIPTEGRLAGSFTRQMHDMEIANLTGRHRQAQEEHYPILLIYPEGIRTYELASYLVETTTRLALGLEPMLKGWRLPYRDGLS